VGGLGYMGLATALAFAHRGIRVRGYEIREELASSLRAGRTLSYEKGLAELLRAERRSGRFDVVSSWEELVQESEIIFLCLQTPRRRDGSIDLRPMRAGSRSLATALRSTDGYRLVVVKSTVVPGTTDMVVRPLVERVSGRGPERVGVAANPEFLAEGSLVADAVSPRRVVFGTSSPRDERWMRRIYAPFRAPIVSLSPTGAELVKYASNAALAMKVTFANEISRLAERVGVDIDEVTRAVGLDPRIGSLFLSAGPGFGGSCFEKDVRALVHSAHTLGEHPRLLEALVPSNADQTRHAFDLVAGAMGRVRGRTVAILGLTFKAGTDDVRESRALSLVSSAVDAGARVRVHDPVALANFRRLWDPPAGRRDPVRYCSTVEEALRGADAAVLQAAWPEYLAWPPRWSRLMRRPLVVDLRRALTPAVRDRGAILWRGLGVGERAEGGARQSGRDRKVGRRSAQLRARRKA
jgi:UDPglucose 6-dehydrogenase